MTMGRPQASGANHRLRPVSVTLASYANDHARALPARTGNGYRRGRKPSRHLLSHRGGFLDTERGFTYPRDAVVLGWLYAQPLQTAGGKPHNPLGTDQMGGPESDPFRAVCFCGTHHPGISTHYSYRDHPESIMRYCPMAAENLYALPVGNEARNMPSVIARAEQDLADTRREISTLESRLSDAKEKAIKISHFLELASVYGISNESAISRANELSASAHISAGGGVKSGGNAELSLRPAQSAPKSGISGKAVRETLVLLRERREPIRTRDLVAILRARGIEVGGKDPVVNLSGYLGRVPELIASRSVGWALREWAESKQESDTSAALKLEDTDNENGTGHMGTDQELTF
jgi:hypothetical protein